MLTPSVQHRFYSLDVRYVFRPLSVLHVNEKAIPNLPSPLHDILNPLRPRMPPTGRGETGSGSLVPSWLGHAELTRRTFQSPGLFGGVDVSVCERGPREPSRVTSRHTGVSPGACTEETLGQRSGNGSRAGRSFPPCPVMPLAGAADRLPGLPAS